MAVGGGPTHRRGAEQVVPTSAGDLSTDHDIFDNYTDDQIRQARLTVACNTDETDCLEILMMLGLYTEEVET